MRPSRETVIFIVALVCALVAVDLVDAGLVVTILVGGAVAGVVALAGTLLFGAPTRPR